ncbi:hypothetical protein SAMD00019534_026620 [Acytostelium subglobosum LB1]|uniref:hypothetical protein n=1 Tax=Acytostelium subglobosum LB1 TaxID=1410327 RepID=UPI000644C6F7|nr:hypothetical protein SAMD00019534_026620 [Acytostelium subglobosum LB1]GAM19487.1 hypothetical protein SAMD00019534_026620 [Acytostelium subglobosum LB1]|eukprot:XP_012757414.1 hypothetical protein SAMD00019534_026620 [Acytostelium subglobosum LB1]
MNSDSDNDTLIASCFDFIDINDNYESESDDDDVFVDPYAMHGNTIHPYMMNGSHPYLHGGIANRFDPNDNDNDSDTESSEDDEFNQLGAPRSSIQGQPRRRMGRGATIANRSESDDSEDEPAALPLKAHSISTFPQSTSSPMGAQDRTRKQFEPTSGAEVLSASASTPSKKQSNNHNNNNNHSQGSGNGRYKSKSKSPGSAKKEQQVVKILQRNDANIEQVNKMFTPTKTSAAAADKDAKQHTPSSETKPIPRASNNRTPKKVEPRERTPKKSASNNNSNNSRNGTPNSAATATATSTSEVSAAANQESVQQQLDIALLKKQYKEERLVGRTLGELPTAFDMDTVTFTASNQFALHEIVLVPRSRGGLTYGKIHEVIASNQCHHDTSVHHPGVNYRAIYPSGAKKENLFKDLPASYLGKLVSRDKVPKTADSIANLPANPLPTTSAAPIRAIGQKASLKDLHNLVFSPVSKFAPNQIALVPRSKGGFTYGGILKECKVPCKVGDVKHEVQGYRVLVEKRKETTIIKDLIVGNIGKIFSVENHHKHQPHEPAQDQTKDETQTQSQAQAQAQTQAQVQASTNDDDEDDDGETILWNGETLATTKSTSTTTTIAETNTKLSQPPVPGARGLIEVPSDSAVFQKSKKNRSPMIVIDGPNVALKYGNSKTFSVLAIKKAIEYYSQRGFEVITFVPEHVATRKPSGPNAPMRITDFQPFVDDMKMFNELVEKGLVCMTPPQDYDDSYAIQYAKKHGAMIVTNDRYNDHINKQETEAERQKARRFIREHCISFTFARHEFLPNPDFVFPNS